MKYVTSLLGCVLCVAVGCQKQAMTDLNGVRVTVVGSTVQVNVVDDTAKLKSGSREYAVAVSNGKLSINGQPYGPVTKGDQVIIAEERISINGKQAEVVTLE